MKRIWNQSKQKYYILSKIVYFLAIENKRVIILMDNIEYVRMFVDKKGKIIFWDSKKYKYIDCIEIESANKFLIMFE